MYDDLISKLKGKMLEAVQERNHWRGKSELNYEYWLGESVAYAEALNLVIDVKTEMEVG